MSYRPSYKDLSESDGDEDEKDEFSDENADEEYKSGMGTFKWKAKVRPNLFSIAYVHVLHELILNNPRTNLSQSERNSSYSTISKRNARASPPRKQKRGSAARSSPRREKGHNPSYNEQSSGSEEDEDGGEESEEEFEEEEEEESDESSEVQVVARPRRPPRSDLNPSDPDSDSDSDASPAISSPPTSPNSELSYEAKKAPLPKAQVGQLCHAPFDESPGLVFPGKISKVNR